MGKITDALNIYLTRADAAVTASKFVQHVQITKGEFLGDIDLPGLRTFMDDGGLEKYNTRDQAARFNVVTDIISPLEVGYYNSATGTGAAVDLENFIDYIMSDYDFGSTAEVPPVMTWDYIEDTGQHIVCRVTTNILSRAFAVGGIV